MRFSALTNSIRTAWEKAGAFWAEPALDTRESLKEFIATRAAFIAQKVAVDYCRGKTGLFSHALFEEKEFQDALTVCRWESFTATLGDLLILAEGMLRAAGPRIESDQLRRMDATLAGFYPAILAAHPPPAHRADKGWGDVEAEFAIRFAAACAASPSEPAQVALHSAKRLFETLPIHSNMRQLDEEIVHGAVLFRMVSIHEQMTRRANPEKLIAALAAAP